MSAAKFVAYYRVSTIKQGRSGLGLEAQKQAVAAYLANGSSTLTGEFIEVESGARDSRPQLAAALASCRLYGATLVIAKLDRLSRDAAFLLNLQKAGVRFVAADMPEANEMTIGIMAVVAQAERKMISDRTKAALEAAKARGQRLGTPGNLTSTARAKGSQHGNMEKARKARARVDDLTPVLRELQAGGASLRGMAHTLNERGISAPRGGSWSAVQVRRALLLTAQAVP